MDEKPASVEISTGINNPKQTNVVHLQKFCPQPVLKRRHHKRNLSKAHAVALGMVQPWPDPLKYNPTNYRTISTSFCVGIVVSILASAAFQEQHRTYWRLSHPWFVAVLSRAWYSLMQPFTQVRRGGNKPMAYPQVVQQPVLSSN